MDWISDPAIWVGFLTLVTLEIVLGIDNLIFIAIVADKLPAGRRDNARRIGLALALGMRLGLLSGISWIVSLTRPVVAPLGFELSWRDIILIVGGAFLLIKATIEIHDRLESPGHLAAHSHGHARFWPTIAQIVVLDAVFSLDSVITAVGMVDELPVMMAAVTVAVIVMLTAARPLTAFLSRHPSVLMLCLGFLLMIGLVLVVDGLGYHLPKGYVYTAIGFAVLIEFFNQTQLWKRRTRTRSLSLRHRTADTVLRLLGGVPLRSAPLGPTELATYASPEEAGQAFTPAEHTMVRSVLSLAERSVRTIMTPRAQITWLDAGGERSEVLAMLHGSPHRIFPVCRGSVDELVGIVRKEHVLERCLGDAPFDLESLAQEPLAIPGRATVLVAFDAFRGAPVEMAIVVDEYGSLLGIVTRADLLEAIAGQLAGPSEAEPQVRELEKGVLSLDGRMTLLDARQQLGIEMVGDGAIETLAGLILDRLGRVPRVGDRVTLDPWTLEVAAMRGLRVERVNARRYSNGTSSSATILMILMSGLIAGPAVSL